MTTIFSAHRLCQARLVASLLGLGGMVGPSVPAFATGPLSTPTASAPSSAQLLDPITAMIGDAACDNQDQCHVVGIGARPCGGPERYLAWSSRVTDPSALQVAVDAQAQAERREHADRGLTSDCRALPEATAVCRPRPADGIKTCQLGQGGVRSAI